MDDLRTEIEKECRLAIEKGSFPEPLDIELKHIYVEELYRILENERFISSPWPVLDLLVLLGVVEKTSRKPGPSRRRWD